MPRLHVNELLDEILSLIETNLKTSLSLKGIYRGELAWLPPGAVSDMANGIWVTLAQATDIEEVQMPKALQFTYRVRLIFVRRIDTTNNVLKTRMDDAETIVEMVYDNFQMSALSLTNGQVLWWLPRSVEWEPAEDAYVSAVSADLTATAFTTEILVRTRI